MAVHQLPLFSNDSLTLTISAPRLEIFGLDLISAPGRYLLVIATTAILWLLPYNIVRSRIGRDWMAIRDMDKAAAVIGIPVAGRQLLVMALKLLLHRHRRGTFRLRLSWHGGCAFLRPR